MGIDNTFKDNLISAGRDVMYEEGLEAISIRRVAAMCGISVGSVYNYFGTKAELIVAIIEENLAQALPDEYLLKDLYKITYIEFLDMFYNRLCQCANPLRIIDWHEQFLYLEYHGKHKDTGLNNCQFDRIKGYFSKALDNDPSVLDSTWTNILTKNHFISFTISYMIKCFEIQEEFRFLKQILAKVIYE